MSESSYRTILRASSIIGSASVISILVGLVKMKVAAVLLGPAGVGLIGLYQSLMHTASTVAGLGITSAGTRRVAEVAVLENQEAVGLARRALFWGTIVQSLVGAMVFWLASTVIARTLVDDPNRVDEVIWLALGVALMVGAGAQTALLTGLRRIGEIAKIQIGGGVLGAVGGVAALWVWGEGGLLALVLIAPLSTFIIGFFYVMRLERVVDRSPVSVVAREWQGMAGLGLSLMISALVTMAGQLAARVLVQRYLGVDALGQFQAAWTIGMTYLTFVLGAMATDYFPRLSAVINDKPAAVRLVNQQTEVALLLCSPILVGMLGCAPLVIRLLYTSEFGPAVDILRWQLLGDIIKVISWPLGFVLLALGAGKTFILTETTGIAVFVLGVIFGLPLIGVTATGVAFLALYLAYLPMVWWFGGRRIDFVWAHAVLWQGGALVVTALLVVFASSYSDFAGIITGLVLATLLALWALIRLASVAGATGPLAPLARLGERLKRWR